MPSQPKIRGTWRDDIAARAVYAEGAGIHRMMPEAIAIPNDAGDVADIVRWAGGAGMPITPRGSGSSMAGGALGPGVILDVSSLAHIGDIDASARSVVVGPGVVCANLARVANTVGLRLPVDPSSAAFCTLGGMASTNAAGARTLRYGQMSSWVRGIECVFANGDRTWIRRGERLPSLPALDRFAALAPQLVAAERATPSGHREVRKDSSGYAIAKWAASGDLVDLLTGSEGTLAVFTALEIQLAAVPAFTGTIVAAFPSLDDAVRAAAVAASLNASACELLDQTFLDIARAGRADDVPDGEAVLIVELEEGDERQLSEVLAAVRGAFTTAGASAITSSSDASHAAALWSLRHAASPIIAAMSDTVKSMQIIEDGAVPPAQLGDYVRGIRRILAGARFRGVIFGHAGDGHVHVNVLVETSESDWRQRLEGVLADAATLTANLGGTMTGEHGDGRLRAGIMDRVWPEYALDRFRMVKEAFDPRGLFNPGVKFPAPMAPPLGAGIKYDPTIPPLPDEARRVLDRVQSERAWNRSRLELLDEEQRR